MARILEGGTARTETAHKASSDRDASREHRSTRRTISTELTNRFQWLPDKSTTRSKEKSLDAWIGAPERGGEAGGQGSCANRSDTTRPPSHGLTSATEAARMNVR